MPEVIEGEEPKLSRSHTITEGILSQSQRPSRKQKTLIRPYGGVGSRTPGDVESGANGGVEPRTERKVESGADGGVEPGADGRVEPRTEGEVESRTEGGVGPRTEREVESRTEGGVESRTEGGVESEKVQKSSKSDGLSRMDSVSDEVRRSPGFKFLTRPDLYKFVKVSHIVGVVSFSISYSHKHLSLVLAFNFFSCLQ